MERSKNERILSFSFGLFCTVGAVVMFTKCVIVYLKDEDTSQVEYQRFHRKDGEHEAIYPSISICFKRPFLEDKLKQYLKHPDDIKKYSKFISGQHWDDQYVDIAYDDVTINLMDYLEKITLSLGNGLVDITWDITDRRLVEKGESNGDDPASSKLGDISPTPAIYLSNRGSEEGISKGKCYTIDIPFFLDKPIHSFQLLINGSIFPDGIQPKNLEFSTWLSYPHQFARSLSSQTLWESRITRSEYYVRNIEVGFQQVLKRRNKPSKPCISGFYDDIIWRRSISRVGCIPAFWPIESNLPKCRDWHNYTKVYVSMDWTKHDNPCIAIEKIYDSFDEDDFSHEIENGNKLKMKGMLKLRFIFPDKRFVEVMYTRAYTFETFVGNAGGYLGLFLGGGVLQLTSTILDCLRFINKRIISNEMFR